ncbi:MAG: DUF1761 domain-containing protein, partial [Gammaproteobacteria bacterium]|nr:DUF1761 domain-containing protein [Gammaproteobacteria bacterium]
QEINGWAILLATVTGLGLGALWYSPLLFGGAWLRATGFHEAELHRHHQLALGATVVTTALSVLALAVFLAAVRPPGLAATLGWSLLAGLGFVATSMLSDHLLCRSPMALFQIQAGYRVALFLVAGLVLGLWP